HEPVSQSDQELLAGGRDRLSGPRANLHRHGAQHHRAGDRGGRHHHGGVPDIQPGHVVRDEPLQRPRRAGRTMTTLDTALVPTPAGAGARAFVRTAPAETLAPPRMHVGWLGWGREHLFSNPLSAALTILIVAALVLIVPPLVNFLLIDA